MRQFSEARSPFINRQLLADDLDRNKFLAINLSHNMETISKVKGYNERIFYIHQFVVHVRRKFTLLI